MNFITSYFYNHVVEPLTCQGHTHKNHIVDQIELQNDSIQELTELVKGLICHTRDLEDKIEELRSATDRCDNTVIELIDSLMDNRNEQAILNSETLIQTDNDVELDLRLDELKEQIDTAITEDSLAEIIESFSFSLNVND